jgi:hypothetical protein
MFVASHAARLLDLLDYLLRSEFEYHITLSISKDMSFETKGCCSCLAWDIV